MIQHRAKVADRMRSIVRDFHVFPYCHFYFVRNVSRFLNTQSIGDASLPSGFSTEKQRGSAPEVPNFQIFIFEIIFHDTFAIPCNTLFRYALLLISINYYRYYTVLFDDVNLFYFTGLSQILIKSSISSNWNGRDR